MPKSGAKSVISNLVVTILASILLIALGFIYFIGTLWIVKASANVLNIPVDGNFLIVGAAILVAGILIGSKRVKA